MGLLGPYNDITGKWCHQVVEIPNRDSLLSLDVITSFAAINYVLDIFFAMLLTRRQEEHVKASMDMMAHRSVLLNSVEESEKEN